MERKSDRDPRLIALIVAAAALALVVVIVLVAGGSDESGETVAGVDGCREVEKPAPKSVDLEAPADGQVLKRGETATAVVETSCGSFTIALDTQRAPKTANSFAYLAEEGALDGTGFHRIVNDFVIQGGDPQGTGSGSPGYSVREAPPKNLRYEPGVVAMAKTGTEPAGTSGSQFFVVTGAGGQSLTPDYALVGKVTEGMDVVERIGSLGDGSEQPTKPVVIDSVTIERS